MESVAYRSFLVRVWSRGRHTARVLVDEVQSGRRSELRGDGAARLVADIEASLADKPARESGRSETPSNPRP